MKKKPDFFLLNVSLILSFTFLGIYWEVNNISIPGIHVSIYFILIYLISQIIEHLTHIYDKEEK